MTIPASPFPALTEAEQVFHTLIWGPLFAAGNTALLAAVPELKWPVVGTLEGAAESYLSDYLFNMICLYVDVEAIRLVNAAHQAEYEAASLQLKLVASQSGSSSTAYQKALADAQTSLSNFVRWYS